MKLRALRNGFTGLTSFKASAKSNELVLEVYDLIGEDFFGQGITAKSFSDAIAAAGEFSRIALHINSPGGDSYEGATIYNMLRGLGKPVTVYIDGLAASAAATVAMSGDEIIMGTGTNLMIHNAWSIAAGSAADLRKTADVLDTVSSSLADIYAERTGMDKKDIQSMMDAETWMDAETAVAKGFATKVASENGKKKAKALAQAFDLSIFANVPEELKAKVEEAPKVETPVEQPKAEETTEIDPLIEIYRKRLNLARSR